MRRKIASLGRMELKQLELISIHLCMELVTLSHLIIRSVTFSSEHIDSDSTLTIIFLLLYCSINGLDLLMKWDSIYLVELINTTTMDAWLIEMLRFDPGLAAGLGYSATQLGYSGSVGLDGAGLHLELLDGLAYGTQPGFNNTFLRCHATCSTKQGRVDSIMPSLIVLRSARRFISCILVNYGFKFWVRGFAKLSLV
nr:hypothetical protein Q903MT_gene2148 [Picea sitchensis]